MPPLNVPLMLDPILSNYDEHIRNFITFLDTHVDCELIYDGPLDIHQHILERTVYACSVQHRPTKKILRNVFPIMLGSRIDLAIRHLQVCTFGTDIPTLNHPSFQEVDIARGFFIICGFLRHLPYFFTNDSTHTHMVQKKKVRVFTYDTLDRGKELSYYVADCPPKKRGDMIVVGNDGSESTQHVNSFFDHCPYRTDAAAYMAHVYQHNRFDIDSLVNKIVVSPGHLFTKLFVKYLYGPLRENNWSLIKSKTTLVIKSIESGCLLHVLSRKTVYFKEGKSAGKMTVTPQESHREIGSNGEVFVEKTIGCYREVNMQTYPLNPYLSYVIVRQMSNKVKHNSVPSFHDSYLGFLCILGCFETKNVGRTTMMVRNTVVSTCDALDPVFHDAQHDPLWTWLQLETESHVHPQYFVVVNEACVPVTASCFQRLSLHALKQQFRHVECFAESSFIYIRYKVGLIFKLLPGTDIWVTPKDMLFWAQKLLHLNTMEALIDRFGYDFITSFHVDLNPFFMHNAFPKNTLAFNALKNAVLATDSRYAHYFMDSLSAYARQLTPYHQTVQEPVEDGISPHFALRVPHVVVSYMSFLGCTQEDGIVCRQDVKAFDCCRFYTIRVKIKADGFVLFHPVQGDPDETSLVGTVVHYGETPLQVEPFSIHVRATSVTDQVIHLHFTKPPFRVIQHHLSVNTLSICLEQDHLASTGDKLCSFHGQKGVLRLIKSLPLLDENIQPDLLVNPYSLFRMTPGQILEGLARGQGKDAQTVRNTEGQVVPHAKAFYAKTFYFPIAYWSSEHFYAPRECTMDKILHQAVKGRSRGGGMRLGNMELFNGLRGNGLAACFEEKFFEHGDRIPNETNATISLPKSVQLVQEDARFFKCQLKYETNPSVTIRKKN